MGKRRISGNIRRKAKEKRVSAAAVFAVCLLLLVFLVGAVIGRYQRQLRSGASVRALEFYFTSDLLDGDTHTLAPGSTEVEFTLSNHADDLRYSEVEISYTVTVDGGASAANVPKVANDKGTLTKGEIKDAVVKITDLQAGTYTITAVGTGGYSKELKATIVIPENRGQIYQHQAYVSGEYILLTVWNEGDVSGTVTIKYDGIPDNTNPNMKDWHMDDGNKVEKTVEIGPHESKVFRFFDGTVNVTGAVTKEP